MESEPITSFTDAHRDPSPRDGYFVVSTKPLAQADPVSKRHGWRVKLTLVILIVTIVCGAALLVVASSAPEPGSKEDLAGRLDAIVPDSMHQIDQFYKSRNECDVFLACPEVTEWYSIQGSVSAARSDLIARLDQEGLEFEPSTVEPNLIVVNQGKYIYFLVFHEPPLDGPLDRTLPSYVEADLTIALRS